MKKLLLLTLLVLFVVLFWLATGPKERRLKQKDGRMTVASPLMGVSALDGWTHSKQQGQVVAPCMPAQPAEPCQSISQMLAEWGTSSNSIWHDPKKLVGRMLAENTQAVSGLRNYLLDTAQWEKIEVYKPWYEERTAWVEQRMDAIDLLSEIAQTDISPAYAEQARSALEDGAAMAFSQAIETPVPGGVLAEACECLEALARAKPEQAEAFFSRHSMGQWHERMTVALEAGLRDASFATRR